MVPATVVTSLFIGVVLTTWQRGLASKVIKLDSDYNRFEAPGQADGRSTTVRVGVYINQLWVDKVSETVKVSMYFRQKWTDERLAFVPPNEKFIAIRWFQREEIWLPDTFFRFLVEPVQSDHYLLKWNRDGAVWYVQRLFATVPLSRVQSHRNDSGEPASDEFILSLLVESFGYTADVVSFEALENPVQYGGDFFINSGNSRFKLTNADTLDCSQNYTTGTYPCLDLRVYLRGDE